MIRTILKWGVIAYIAQALIGIIIGGALPWLIYFGAIRGDRFLAFVTPAHAAETATPTPTPTPPAPHYVTPDPYYSSQEWHDIVAKRIKEWAERCHPVIVTDQNNVRRYEYSGENCELVEKPAPVTAPAPVVEAPTVRTIPPAVARAIHRKAMSWADHPGRVVDPTLTPQDCREQCSLSAHFYLSRYGLAHCKRVLPCDIDADDVP